MKSVTYALLCLAILFSTASGNTYDIPKWLRLREDDLQCPQPTGQFSHPRYCDFFLNCWEGHPVVGRCQEGLAFNEKYMYCDYKHNVNCAGRPNSQDSQMPNDPICPQASGTFTDHADCSQYIVCQDGISSVKRCPPNMKYFHSTIAACHAQRPSRCPEVDLSPPPTPVAEVATPSPPSTILQPPLHVTESSSPVSVKPSLPTEKPSTTNEIPDYEIAEPVPEISAGGTPTLTPTSPRPQAPFRPKPPREPGIVPPVQEITPPTESMPETISSNPNPEKPLAPEKPPSSILQPPPEEPSSTNKPQVNFSPKPPFVPETPPKPPQQTELPSKPPKVPEESHESVTPSEGTPINQKPPLMSNLKPKPPLQPKPEEDTEKPPWINLDQLKPKPPFIPPASGQNPGDAPPPKPPVLNPDLFKPQRPPPNEPFITTTTPPPIDGEDDPHILFPFLPKFPDLFKCPVETVMLPVLGDCTSLISCIAGVGQRLLCPSGMYFDPIQNSCTLNNKKCKTTVPNFIRGMSKDTTPDVLYAYLPVSKFSQLLKINLK